VGHSVRLPVGFGLGIKTKGRQLQVMDDLKKSIIEVKEEKNCLAHALIIAIAKITKDPNYKAYIHCRKKRPVVGNFLETTGINLDNGAGITEHEGFQDHFLQYKIILYTGLNCDNTLY
jgi:hypothetical protein